MTREIVVSTTTPTEELSREIARLLVVKGLAACVQVSGPINSFYKWKGQINEDVEWFCLIKTTQENYKDIEQCILDLHSYEVPEIIVTGIQGGYKLYLDWLNKTADQ